MMDIAEAFQIVIELAKENIAPDEQEFEAIRKKQLEAIAMLEDLAVNEFGEN